MKTDTWLLDWKAAFPAGPEVCGGKGWNLARLARYGFPVPAGGIVIERAYHELLANCLEPGEGNLLQAINAESVTEEAVIQLLQSLRDRILGTPIPAGVEDALATFLDAEGSDTSKWAVRSSAIAEDGESHSFAGIHESVLNVPGDSEKVIDAIRQCYASLWTPQAVAYRRHAGIRDADSGCAVVICRMVTSPGKTVPAAAGVLFTCDPISGRRDQAIINSVAGLADQLVAGAVTPDQHRVNTHLLHYRLTSGEQTSQQPPSVDDQVLIDLARWGMRAQWALGEGDLPQDMEWAYDGSRLWFLQARPITRLPHRSFSAINSLPVIWSNANLKEVVGGVPTAFSWSLIQDAVRDLLFTPLQAVGYPIPEGMPLLRRFHGRTYFDLSALQWAYYDCFGYPPAQLNRELGGNQPTIPVAAGDPMKGEQGRKRQRRQLRALFALRGIGKRLAKAYEETLTKVVAFRQKSLDDLSDTALREELRQWRSYGTPLTHLFQFANSDAGVWLKFARDLLTWLDPKSGEELLGLLLAAAGQMPSAEGLHQLHNLAAVAGTDKEARTWLQELHHDDQNATKKTWQDLHQESQFRTAFTEYLKRYGHRAVNETELSNPRWYEDPSHLLKEVARLLCTPGQESTESARLRRLEAERELRRLPWWSRPLVRLLAARARRGMARRETGKSLTIAVLEPLRRIALEIGQRLSKRGLLETREQVFQLALADLDALLAGTWNGTGAESLAADRERQRNAWQQAAAPDVIIEGDRKSLRETDEEKRQQEEGLLWQGIGVSPGEASGYARILHTPEEGARLGKGEILVAATTDTGWTPLFLRAGGIITEVGGYLSHGAIVARELGIPAVVNLPDALSRLADEPAIKLNGGQGTVSPVSPES